MRRTKDLNLGLLASIAAATLAMTGCAGKPMPRRCIDADQRVVSDDKCDQSEGQGPVTTGGVYPYRWYYGGSSGYLPVGTGVSGGSVTRPEGVSTFSQPTSGTTVSGVFGSSAASHGGGEGAGE